MYSYLFKMQSCVQLSFHNVVMCTVIFSNIFFSPAIGRSETKKRYSRTSMARTLMARLPCLTRTRSLVPMIPYMRVLWSNFYIYVFMLSFSFSIFSDRRSLKIENENKSSKTLTVEAQYTGRESLEFSL